MKSKLILLFVFVVTFCFSQDMDQAFVNNIYAKNEKMCNEIDHDKISKEILIYVNKFRKANSLDTLVVDPQMEYFTKNYVKQMVDSGTYEHSNLNNGSYTAENIDLIVANLLAVNSKIISNLSSHTVQSWISSKGHKENLLGNYKKIGVACYTKVEKTRLVYKVVMVFY